MKGDPRLMTSQHMRKLIDEPVGLDSKMVWLRCTFYCGSPRARFAGLIIKGGSNVDQPIRYKDRGKGLLRLGENGPHMVKHNSERG